MTDFPPEVLAFIGRARKIIRDERLEMDEARIERAIELATEIVDHNRCLTDEWGLPLPGDADAIESWAERHQPRYLFIGTNRHANAVRLFDSIWELERFLDQQIVRRFADYLVNIEHRIHFLGEVVPVDGPHPGRGSQHYECRSADVTDDF